MLSFKMNHLYFNNSILTVWFSSFKIPLLLITAFIILVNIIPLYSQGTGKTVDFKSSNLPVIIINTGGKTIPNDDVGIKADMGIIFNGSGKRNYATDQPNNYTGKVNIEVRGESSAAWDNKSYSIETQNDDGSERDASLLGLPPESDWVLYTPYYDRSLMRNVLTYHLSRKMGWYASRTVYCELILNGEYRGIYVLMEKIKRDKNRVNIAKLDPDETSGTNLTGGYLLRVDKEEWKKGFDSQLPPFYGSTKKIRYQYRYPKDDDIVPEQESYISNFMYSFENTIKSGFFSNPTDGYQKYLNINSFIDFVLINELSRNVDGYRLSAYMYKQNDSDGGKLFAGPVWDYDFSYGDVDYYNTYLSEGWQLLYFADDQAFHNMDNYQMPGWWKPLFTDKYFNEKLSERWFELRKGILKKDSIYAYMDIFADTTAEARVRNFEKWPGPGSTNLGSGWFPKDPRSAFIKTYEDELSLTKEWISKRIDWIDKNLQAPTDINEDDKNLVPSLFRLNQNYPNPFNASTKITYYVPEKTRVEIKIYDIQGRLIESIFNGIQETGEHTVLFNAEDYTSGIYICKLQTEKYSDTKKMILMK